MDALTGNKRREANTRSTYHSEQIWTLTDSADIYSGYETKEKMGRYAAQKAMSRTTKLLYFFMAKCIESQYNFKKYLALG